MLTWQTSQILVGGIATLAIFSFLVKENPFFRFFEHLYIGIASGFGLILGIKNFFWPKIFTPILGLNINKYPDGTFSAEYSYAYLLFIFPMLFGLLYYTVYSRKYSWMAKLVIGLSLGYAAGLAPKGFIADMLPQMIGSFKPLLIFSDSGIDYYQSLSNCVFVFTLVAVMYYFFFSFKRGSEVGAINMSGRWLMMICFGAFFGSTVMARMAILVERVQFLIEDWSPTLYGLF